MYITKFIKIKLVFWRFPEKRLLTLRFMYSISGRNEGEDDAVTETETGAFGTEAKVSSHECRYLFAFAICRTINIC